ncbi:MAG: glycosyltransferase family 2 protein [Candidatus Omnitrophota bacterium]
MKFSYSPHHLSPSEKILHRCLEILPGAVSWGILAGMVFLSVTRPLTAAALIIAFDLYWILRLFYMNIFLALSYARLSWKNRISWETRLRDIKDPTQALRRLDGTPAGPLEKFFLRSYRKELLEFKNSNPPEFEDIYHLVIFPVAGESRSIVEAGLRSLKDGSFPAKRMLVMLAVEERSQEPVKSAMEQLGREYKDFFLDLIVTFHPDGVPGEARVKGANAAFAARRAAAFLTEKQIPFEHVIMSCFDADTVASPDYFLCLAYTFIITPQRNQASYQPIPVYQNNIWEAPAFARVLDIGSSFFQLIEATNPDRLVTFSSHSMSFKALVAVDYWPVDMISDDSAIFWKAYIHFDGRYRVVPMATTLSMDITEASTWRKTFINVYKQKRRWAWGVENFPLVIRAFLASSNIPFSQKLQHGFKLLEGHVSWATWSFLLTFIGWLPTIFASREFTHSVLYYTAPRVTTAIFSLATIGLLNCVILSLLLLPKNPKKNTVLRRISHAIQWLLLPGIMVFLSGLPALDAQTRLMLGKRMEFWVTAKDRKKETGD